MKSLISRRGREIETGRLGDGETGRKNKPKIIKGDEKALSGEKVKSHKELRVYQNAMDAAMEIFQITKRFPKEETYSMVDQMRRSSRSVCANIAESWRKRRYQAAFVAKLSDVESEACETQVWIELARRCEYITKEEAASFEAGYDKIISQIVKMIQAPEKWILPKA